METSTPQGIVDHRIKWNEVTWYSKLGAIIVFLIIVPVLCFSIGMQFGQLQSDARVSTSNAVNGQTLSINAAPASKTYTSLKYGFSFEYPSSWSVITSETGLATRPGKVAETTIQTSDSLHIIQFLIYKIADLKQIVGECRIGSYDQTRSQWKIETIHEDIQCSEAKAGISYEEANTLVGNAIPAYSDISVSPSVFLVPLQNGYGIEIKVVNRGADDAGDGSLLDPMAKPILETLRVE